MPKKILLADDSITIQKVVELTFSDGDYEVVATNNGSKAIEALQTLRPDIILSDIIMPEKNGYEVCEYVKSHPELKHIPVILLTGTFEPFDPDRAEKAGCDAVVTKPFESQGLIQKVEQLIQHAASAALTVEEAAPAFAPPQPPVVDDGPFMDEPVAPAPEPPRFSMPEPAGDVFGDTPADEAEDSGATKLIPKMTFDDLQRMAVAPAPADLSEETPLEEPPAPPMPAYADQPDESPFAAPEPPPPPPMEAMDSGATKLIPKMTFDDLQAMRNDPPPEPLEEAASPFDDVPPAGPVDEAPELISPAPDTVPWSSAPEPASPPEPKPAPFSAAAFSSDEPEDDDDSGATKLIPKLTFDDLQKMRDESTAPSAAAPEQSATPDGSFGEAPSALDSPFDDEPAMLAPETPPIVDDSPFDAEEPTEPESSFEPTPMEAAAPFEKDALGMTMDADDSAGAFEPPPDPEPEPVVEEPEEPIAAFSGEPGAPLSGDVLGQSEIDRIARRVVEMMSDTAIKDVAWEVIPEVAEMAVRERIRELEAEEE